MTENNQTLETIHLDELNKGYKEVSLRLDIVNQQISSLQIEKEHYKQMLSNLESIGVCCGYEYSEEKNEWVLKSERSA